jgi:hypothetical protein
MPTTTPILEFSGLFLPKLVLDKTDIDAIVQGKLFVHFWGLSSTETFSTTSSMRSEKRHFGTYGNIRRCITSVPSQETLP